ncbi:LAMI_0H01332g1_1 [Lachancea mirantina]|uniref:LAMI_0H01332g1_1 n=1 Tax=Lachancea mirantina TaxID=1230905 RepID=A0A1G4KDT0_9SACH|nr:LAMI_0H01332g1_1 [Lachancea mirantina]
MENQTTFILLSYYLSNSLLEQALSILQKCSRSETVRNAKAVLVFWPALSEPRTVLKLIEALESSHEREGQEFWDDMLDDEMKLIVELESDALSKRYDSVMCFINDTISCQAIEMTSENWCFELIKGKIRGYDKLLEDPSAYKVVWNSHLAEKYPDLQRWTVGVVKPLGHLNARSSDFLTIELFEKLNYFEALELMWFTAQESNRFLTLKSVLAYEIIPLMKYRKSFDFVVERIFSLETFSLQFESNYELLKYSVVELSDQFNDDIKMQLQGVALDILFQKSKEINYMSSSDLSQDLLQIFRKVTTVTASSELPSIDALRAYARLMPFLRITDLSEIRRITQETGNIQKSFFSSAFMNILEQDDRASILESFNTLLEDRTVFSIPIEDKRRLAVDALLTKRRFDILKPFVENYHLDVEHDLLKTHFWHIFNSSSGGNSLRSDVADAREILSMLTEPERSGLETLLEVIEDLSRHSLRLGQGKEPLKPLILMEFKNNVVGLISVLLEHNTDLYKDVDFTKSIAQGFSRALSPDIAFGEKECLDLLRLHIEFALADFDFEFAYGRGQELLASQNCSEYWLTIFQIGKFFDPSWPDNEIPTEIIYLQLEILGKLLHVCPVEETEAIISHWSGLELELASRDILDDEYSLRNNKSTQKFKNIILKDATNSVSNFLSGSLKWSLSEGR